MTYDEYGNGRLQVVITRVAEKVPVIFFSKTVTTWLNLFVSVPDGIALEAPLLNPGLPKQPFIPVSRFKPPSAVLSTTVGSGLKRTYLDIQSAAPAIGYPPRPAPGSIADLDIVMDHCDFGNNKVSTQSSCGAES